MFMNYNCACYVQNERNIGSETLFFKTKGTLAKQTKHP